jgi:intein-encoded DNA endonuclease-like protein
MASPTALYQLIEDRLDGTLAELVQQCISEGKSWRAIARDVHAKTGVEVSRMTLAEWFKDRVKIRVTVS